MTILAACLVTVIAFGSLIAVFFGAVKLFVVASPKYPVLPYGLALLLAWLCSWPLGVAIIQHSPFNELHWGHAGELFVLPAIPTSLVMAVVTLSQVKRRVEGNGN